MSKFFKQMFFCFVVLKELTGINGIPRCSENITATVFLMDFEDTHDFSEFKFELKISIIVRDIVKVNEREKSIKLYV